MKSRALRATPFCLGMLLASGLATAPAMAQTETPPTPEPQADPAAASEDGAIIVTARRIAEDIQDVPISIQVFNQEQLRSQNVNSAVDLTKIAPGLIASQKYGPDNATFSMRGFFQELRTTASVGVYFADVVAPRAPGSTSAGDGAGPGSFFDLQNVQVLKGPQGTLFGRNTTGGAVLLVPRKPTEDLEGYAELTYGSYNLMQIQGVVNIPISDAIRFRAGVDVNQRDGYLKNISPVGPRRFGDVNYIAARTSLVIDLTPKLENYTIFTYAKSDTRGLVAHMEEAILGRPNFGPYAQAQLIREAGNSIYEVANSQADPLRWQETIRLINTTTFLASDALTIKNIASFSRIKVRERGDPFGTFFLIPALAQPQQLVLTPFATLRSVPGGYSNHQRSITEEFRLNGNIGGDRFIWQAGVYYESSKGLSPAGTAGPSGYSCASEPTEFQCQRVQGISASFQWQQLQSDYRNLGIYAQGSLKLADFLTFTAGARYTWDKVESDFWQYNVSFPTPNNPTFACLYSTLDPTPVTYAEILALSRCQDTAAVKSSAPTWTVSLEARPTDNLMLYVKWSRGYRQGNTNPFSLPGFKTFDDEKVNVYEAGFKASWRGGMPGNLNVTAYYNDFTNQQIQAGALRPGLAPNAVVLNAGSSRMYGVEVEAAIRPFRGMRLSASYNYLNTKLQSANFPGVFGPLPELGGAPGYRLPDGSAVFPTSTVGTPLPLSPKHQVALSATYQLPVAEHVGRIEIGATYSYTSEQFFTFSNAPRGRFEPYDLVNANINWNGVAGSPIDLSLFVTNLFKEKYVILVNEQTSSGFVSRNYGEPRMFGGRVRYNFGRN